jgi:hypothetical protein
MIKNTLLIKVNRHGNNIQKEIVGKPITPEVITSDSEIDRLTKYLQKIGQTTRLVSGRCVPIAELAKIRGNKDEFSGQFDFKLILTDVCLAWRNQYKKKVIPRIEAIRKRFENIKTLEELRGLIERLGDRFNREFWDYNDRRRQTMLRELVDEFIKYKKRHDIFNDLEAMKHWAEKAVPADYQAGINGAKISYLGIANYQYLRMLCGVDTIKT